jgi:hypothetical protein
VYGIERFKYQQDGTIDLKEGLLRQQQGSNNFPVAFVVLSRAVVWWNADLYMLGSSC